MVNSMSTEMDRVFCVTDGSVTLFDEYAVRRRDTVILLNGAIRYTPGAVQNEVEQMLKRDLDNVRPQALNVVLLSPALFAVLAFEGAFKGYLDLVTPDKITACGMNFNDMYLHALSVPNRNGEIALGLVFQTQPTALLEKRFGAGFRMATLDHNMQVIE